MSLNFLKSKYSMTTIEALVFMDYQSGLIIDCDMSGFLIRALRKISNNEV
jgi:hypothetical protein